MLENILKFEINQGTKMFTHDRQTTTTTNAKKKMFGIAKVARVLGAQVFLQWFCIQKKFRIGKDIEKSRLFFEFLHP